jgi:hypothetical protein
MDQPPTEVARLASLQPQLGWRTLESASMRIRRLLDCGVWEQVQAICSLARVPWE